MSNEKVYLKQNVLIEPLFNQWYAWSYLLAPATAAMYIANSHVKIMQSFIAAPQTHIAALKNPAMMGGPFITYDESKVPQIKALLERTLKEQKHMLGFAEAVKALDDLLTNEAGGYGLASLYAKVDDALKGYVELVYDLNNNPSIRFIEGLLYESHYYDEASQSLALSLINSDGRPFVFSTPRLENGSQLHLRKSFSDEGIDALCQMKTVPQPYGFIAERLAVTEEEDTLFSSFFTTEEPPIPVRYKDDGVKIRYLGHACVLVETRDVSLLTDPLLSYKYETTVDRFTYADLPERINYVLLTHNHQDHCLFETLLQLRHRIDNLIVPKSAGGLADPSLKLLLKHVGFKNVVEIDEMEAIEVEGGRITGLPFLGEHADLNIRTKGAYLVTLKGRSIIFAADSNNVETQLYHNIHSVIGDVDIIFIGMECVGGPLTWLYGPLLTKPLVRKMDQSRRFNGSNYDAAIEIVNVLKPSRVYVYAMGQEPWLTFLTSLNYNEESCQIVESNRLVEECRRRGLTAERVFCRKEIVLDPA
jgi:L-ascorbate metabolism protein UlaG (beta-lactamase superfamily)